jgi:abequosyltransferase
VHPKIITFRSLPKVVNLTTDLCWLIQWANINFQTTGIWRSMQRLLTISIPTYNRANFLNNQLTWLSKAINHVEDQCEIFISDNCSTDDTPQVIQKWQDKLSRSLFQWNRNPENVGLMRNIGCCIRAAQGKFIWVIGDDDPINERAIAYIIKTLSESPDITWLNLNFSCRDGIRNTLIFDRCYSVDTDEVSVDGKAVFESCLRINNSGVGVMTAQVYRTALVQQALEAWPSLTNGEAQVYWTGFCAFHGSVKISKETYLEYIAGTASWMRDKKQLLRMHYNYLPEVYAKISEVGYSQDFCRSLIIHHFFANNWRVFLGAMRRWPVLTIQVISRYLLLVCRVCLYTDWRFTQFL